MQERTRDEKAELGLLTGAAAGDMLRVALARHGIVRSWTVHTVHHRPGAGVSVGYAVVLDILTNGARNRVEQYVLATTGRVNEDRLADVDGVTLRFNDIRVHVWEHPADPELPALARACSPDLLSGEAGHDVDIELIAYRPTRRAVVRIDHPDCSRFVKVVRPRDVATLVSRLTMLTRAGVPSPRLVNASADGFVETEAIAGIPLTRVYAAARSEHAGQMRKLLIGMADMLDDLPLTALAFKARPAWVDRCEHYAHAAALTLPDRAAEIAELTAGIRDLLADGDMGPIVPTHGDFYEANIFIDPESGAVSGLLDVDALGPGYRVNDWACLLGHLSVLPHLAPKYYAGLEWLVGEWLDVLGARVDPVALCASSAGVVLSLVPGARRSKKHNWVAEAENRLSVAQQWLNRGRAFRDGNTRP